MFSKKGVLRNFTKLTGKHLCQSLFLIKLQAIKKETLAQVFSCEFCEISKNTFFHRTPLVAASGSSIVQFQADWYLFPTISKRILDRSRKILHCHSHNKNWNLSKGIQNYFSNLEINDCQRSLLVSWFVTKSFHPENRATWIRCRVQIEKNESKIMHAAPWNNVRLALLTKLEVIRL